MVVAIDLGLQRPPFGQFSILGIDLGPGSGLLPSLRLLLLLRLRSGRFDGCVFSGVTFLAFATLGLRLALALPLTRGGTVAETE